MDPARAALLLLLAAAPAGAAEPEPAEAPSYETVVTAARREQPRLEADRAVSVVDRSTSRRMVAASPVDALSAADGVALQRTSSSRPTVFVRGLTGYRVLVLYDDLRLSDTLTKTGGNALLGLLDPESVRGIEVVRGPASVLYGSDALGGVVHALPEEPPRPPEEGGTWEAEAFLRGASAEHAWRGRASLAGAVGALAARASGGYGSAGGVTRGGDLGDQPYTGSDDWAASARVVAYPAPDQRVGLAWQRAQILDEYRSDKSEPGDVRSWPEHTRDIGYAWYDARLLRRALRLTLKGGVLRRSEWERRERTEKGIDDDRNEVLTLTGSGRAIVAPWDRATLTFGGDVALDQVSSIAEKTRDGVTTKADRGRYLDGSLYNTGGLYALLEQRLSEGWAAEGGVRLALNAVGAPADPFFPDRPRQSTASAGLVGSLGIRAPLGEGAALVVSGLTGYRSPNLEDYQVNGSGSRAWTIPNPDLGDERSWTLEAGVKVERGAWTGQVFGWGSRLTGLIVRVPSTFRGQSEWEGDPVKVRENASDATLLGGEAQLAWRPWGGLRVALGTGATWGEMVRPDGAGADLTEPAPKIPPPTGRLTLGWDAPGGRWWAEAEASGVLAQTRLADEDRDDARICPGGPCDETDPYLLGTVRGGVHLSEDLTLLAAVENITDAAWRPFASGVEGHGLNAVVALRARAGD